MAAMLAKASDEGRCDPDPGRQRRCEEGRWEDTQEPGPRPAPCVCHRTWRMLSQRPELQGPPALEDREGEKAMLLLRYALSAAGGCAPASLGPVTVPRLD